MRVKDKALDEAMHLLKNIRQIATMLKVSSPKRKLKLSTCEYMLLMNRKLEDLQDKLNEAIAG